MTSRLRKCVFFAVLSIVLSACEERRSEPYEFTELAMVPGMVIEAENRFGKVRIEALSVLERKFEWDNFSETRTLIPREERFEGRLGAYDPAPMSVFNFWDRIRIVADDSQLHFETMKEIEARLYEGNEVFDWVYTDDGLVVGFGKVSDRKQVNILVYQFYLQGQKPSGIPGSRPGQIRVTYSQDAYSGSTRDDA